MKSRWWTTLIIPAVVSLGACEPRPDPAEDVTQPDTVFDPGMQIPGAPGTITRDVDRRPEPRLRPDTPPEMPETPDPAPDERD